MAADLRERGSFLVGTGGLKWTREKYLSSMKRTYGRHNPRSRFFKYAPIPCVLTMDYGTGAAQGFCHVILWSGEPWEKVLETIAILQLLDYRPANVVDCRGLSP